jgi:hypothetical protein
VLRHYVFLKYRDGTSDDHVAAFCERLLALRGTIEGIEHLEIGRDELHDARSWDMVLIMRFASLDALRAYQRHPQHLAVMAFNAPFVTGLGSVDFTSPQTVE